MKIELVYAILTYSAIAFVMAWAVVFTQMAFVSAATRFGRRLLPMVPVLGWASMALTNLFSKRNLNSLGLDSNPVGDGGSAWINRGLTAVLMAIAVAKIVEALYSRRRKRGAQVVLTADERANRRLFVAMVAYLVGSLALPMMFSANPGFVHDGIPAALAMVAVYTARRDSLDNFIAGAKWTLFIVMLGGLVVAAVHPDLAVETSYTAGWIPGLHLRLWGLAAHANALGALALYLILLLVLQPARRLSINLLMWGVVLLALLLAQSKTSWLSAVLVGVVMLAYGWGRDPRGGLRPSFIIALLVGLAGFAAAMLFLDTSRLFDHFMDTDTGTRLTTLTGRTEIWTAAYNMWQDSPFFGYGLEAWAPLHRIQLGLPFATQAHNQLMQALALGGVFDLLPLLVYLGLLAAGAARAARRTRGVTLAFMVMFLFRGITEVPFDFGLVTGSDVLAQLLLFALVVNEYRPPAVAEASAAGVALRTMPLHAWGQAS